MTTVEMKQELYKQKGWCGELIEMDFLSVGEIKTELIPCCNPLPCKEHKKD